MASSADGTRLIAGGRLDGVTDHDFLYTSADSGATWTPVGPQQSWTSVASSSDGTKLVAAGGIVEYDSMGREISASGYIYVSADSGATWTQSGAPNQTWVKVVSSADGSKLVAIGGSDVYTSTDSGMTWSNSGQQPFLSSVALSADGTRLAGAAYCDPDHCGQPPNGGYIYTSTDFGTTWMQTGPQQNWTTVASSADGTKLVAAASDWVYPSGHIYTYP